MKKLSYFLIALLGVLGAGFVSFLVIKGETPATLARRAEIEWEAVVRKVNPPDPHVPTPAVDLADSKKLLDQPGEPSPRISAEPTASPSPTLVPPPSSYVLPAPAQEYQTWNNCGPATATMLLRMHGKSPTQAEMAQQLKPNPDDKNVNPEEIETVLSAQDGLTGLYRMNGTLDILKQLLAHDIPVVVEVWFEREPNDGMGHYRLIRGYDDTSEQFLAMDSYQGPNRSIPYRTFEDDWQVYAYTYIIAYAPDKEEDVARIIGGERQDETMYANTAARARQEIERDDRDAYAWFNLGTALSKQNKHEEAALAFDTARSIGLPWRMLWYQFAIFESYLAMERYEDVLELTQTNLNQSNDLEESYLYRARALEALGRQEEAEQAYQRAKQLES